MLDCQDSVRQKVSTFSVFTEQCLTMPTRQRKELQEFKDAGWVVQSWRRRDIERRWRLWEKCRLERKKRSEKENDRVKTFSHGLFVYVSLGCHFSFHFFFFSLSKILLEFLLICCWLSAFHYSSNLHSTNNNSYGCNFARGAKCIKFKILKYTFTLVLRWFARCLQGFELPPTVQRHKC